MSCRCDADGVEAVLEVKAHNTRAIGLYKKHGFVDVGLRRKYYADGSDALLLARHPAAAAAAGGPPSGDDTSSSTRQ
jgi:ribosomal-protein-alanine N-acetyltransferase